MRAKRRERQSIASGGQLDQTRVDAAGVRPPAASPALALQERIRSAIRHSAREEPLPIGQRILIIVLLAAISWGLIAGLVVAIVR